MLDEMRSLGRPPDAMATRLDKLPSDVLLSVLGFLSPSDVRKVAYTSTSLRLVAISDAVWRPIVVNTLRSSPPAHSEHLTPLRHAPAPWDPSFGAASAGRSAAQREQWLALPYGRVSEQYEDESGRITLDMFEGAHSFYHVYWSFLHLFTPLMGWWLGDVNSYGMTVRIVFDQARRLDEHGTRGPAFVCEKLHFVNRLYGIVGDIDVWKEASGFELNLPLSRDGTSFETETTSIDVSVPGIKTETLWTASWRNSRQRGMQVERFASRRVAKLEWNGANSFYHSEPTRNNNETSGGNSIVQRAHDLASQMVFGDERNEDPYGTEDELLDDEEDMDLEDEFDEEDTGRDWIDAEVDEVFGLGAWPLHIRDTVTGQHEGHPQPSMRLPPVIRQYSAGFVHTVYLTSGAVCTAPAKADRKMLQNGRVEIFVQPCKPYHSSTESSKGGFGVKLTSQLPLPSIEFPSPALLPLIRELSEDSQHAYRRSAKEQKTSHSSSSTTFQDFLDVGTEVSMPTMRMEPCPPYLPWPHLSQPLSAGIRFVPIRSPLSHCLLPRTERFITASGESCFKHVQRIDPCLDPGSNNFDWSNINGLYAMTYGPWGQELIYIRTRILTVHDFAPDDLYLSEGFEATLRAEKRQLSRPTGPHGTGHTWHRDRLGQYWSQEQLCEGLHWKPEPYIDVSDLESSQEETKFIRPGCRVIEGVKCTGDANVPRGTITFRAFSKGQAEDQRVEWFAPDLKTARHAPWLGMQRNQQTRSLSSDFTASSRHPNTWKKQESPGRILEYATGRLAMEGFVHAGTWRRCSVKITSVDQINIHWHALHKVAVAHRLYNC